MLGREFESRRSHTNWDFSSYHAQQVCVFFFFPSILDVKFVGCTSRGRTGGRSHRISRPPFSAVHAFIFLARRIQPSFPSSTVKSNLVYLRFNRSPLVGHFFFFFFFCSESQRVRRLRDYQLSYRGGKTIISCVGTQSSTSRSTKERND